MLVFLLAVSLIAFSKVINNEPLFVYFLLLLYRNQRDFQESLPLNVLNVGARLESASGNETGNERLHSESLVQQEDVYTELFPESMMVIILTTKLELPSVSLSKEGLTDVLYFPFFNFLTVPLCSLHEPLFPALMWRL